MNTKGMKFLAALAVFVMAFAVIALVPAGMSDAAVIVSDPTIKNVTTIDGEGTEYYYNEDLTVKVTGLSADGTVIYVNNGTSVELKFRFAVGAPTGELTIVTVAGDREGKSLYEETKVVFTPVDKKTLEYTAASVTSKSAPDLSMGSSASVYYDGVFEAEDTIGASTSVAQGRTIEIKDIDLGDVQFTYGIAYPSGEGNYVFTASGDSVGSIEVAKEDVISIKSGSVVLSAEKATVNISKFTTGVLSVTSSDGDALSVTGTVNSYATGSLTLSGVIEDFSITVTSGMTVNVSKGAEVTSVSGVTNDGTIVLKNSSGITGNLTNNGTLIAENSELWTYYLLDNNGDLNPIIENTGMIDTRAISKRLGTSGGIITDLTVEKNQTIVLEKDTTVEGIFWIEGIVIIEDGVKLTVVEDVKAETYGTVMCSGDFAIVENNGIIQSLASSAAVDGMPGLTVADKANFINNGSITTISKKYSVEGGTQAPALYFNSENLLNNGTITIGKNDYASIIGMKNTGSITVQGGLDAINADGEGNPVTNIINEGSIVLTSTTINGTENQAFTIKLVSDKAELKVTQVTLDSLVSFIVTNDKAKVGSKTGSSTVVFSYEEETGTKAYSIKNISFVNDVITVKTEYDTEDLVIVEKETKNAVLDLSGSLQMTQEKNANGTFAVEYSGDLSVIDSFTLPAGIDMKVIEGEEGKVIVSGTMNIAKEATFAGDIYVFGKLTVSEGATFSDDSIKAGAEYGTTTKTVTTLEGAITEASAAEIDDITLYGIAFIDGLNIPEGISLNGDGTIYLMSGLMTVDPEAVLAVDVTVVSGILSTDDISAIQSEITADVIFTEEDDESVTYMDFVSAVLVGQSFTLNEDDTEVYITKDVTIPESVIVNTGERELVLYGATLTIDGRLIVGSTFNVMDSYTQDSEIVVDGYFMSVTDYSNTWWYPAGIQYTTEYNDEEYNVVTSLANINSAIAEDDDGKITITENTDVKGDLNLVGPADKDTEITILGDIKNANIAIDNVTLILFDGKSVDGSFSNAYGSMVLTDATTKKMVISDGEDALLVQGTIDDKEETESETAYTATFLGFVDSNGLKALKAESYDDEDVESPQFTVVGTLSSVTKSIEIEYGATVTGDLIAANSAKIVIAGDVEVLGSLIAMPRTDDAAAGSVTVEGSIYAGELIADMFDEDGTHVSDTAAAAIVSGNVTFEGTLYATADSVIDEAIVEDMYSLEIEISEIEFMSIYTDKATVNIAGLVLPITEAKAIGGYDILGNFVAPVNTTYNTIASDDDHNMAAFDIKNNTYIDIAVKYDVYEVRIVTDDGIKSVSIDGVVMTSDVTNQFITLEKIEAGVHKIEYTLKQGYEGTPVLKDSKGTPIAGYNITIGDVIEQKTFTLTGTAPTPEPEPEPTPTPEEKSEWTITTILLVILVILIAIMAVIVALRLNRS